VAAAAALAVAMLLTSACSADIGVPASTGTSAPPAPTTTAAER
jgi:hypothetical protein